jgi:hypothetical protein
MRHIRRAMRSTSGDLAQQAAQIERQVAQVEHIMHGSRQRDQIVPHFTHAIQKCREAVVGLRYAAKVSEEWAVAAVGGGAGSAPSEGSAEPESVAKATSVSNEHDGIDDGADHEWALDSAFDNQHESSPASGRDNFGGCLALQTSLPHRC